MDEQKVFEIIRRAQQELACSVCGRRFEIEEVHVRGVMNDHYLIQTSCRRGHNPAILLYVVGNKTISTDALSTDDVLDLHQALKTFNGDFRSAFGAQRT